MPSSQIETSRSEVNTLAETLGSLTVRATYEPLKASGALKDFKYQDSNPVIGREYLDVQLVDLINAEDPNVLRDLSITVHERGVVFFRSQKAKLTDDQLKKLATRLGDASGRPSASKLHIHPTEYLPDPELSPITASFNKRPPNSTLFASRGFHTDITFEPVPSDIAILQIYETPKDNAGDTIWASAFEAYDRLSPDLAKFLETLTCVHDGNGFHQRAKGLGIPIHEGPRGHPLNVGSDLSTVHPLIRTNPVTGWKGLFVNKGFSKRIVELNLDESEILLNYLFRIVADNHDLQVRFTWDINGVAIWSNTSTFHSATNDYFDNPAAVRKGNRVVSLGEKPYLDPNSKSRREALGLPAWTE
ncbi:taurine catabolism dioxygenase [Meredithblackwellia eburnea MCA 4105]